MKKLVKIMLGLVCLVVLAMPVGLTLAVKRGSQSLVDQLNQQQGLTATLVSNRQGYFSSDAEIAIKATNVLDPSSPPLGINLQLQMQHGPLIWSPHLTFGWAHVTFVLAPDFNSGLQNILASDANGAFYQLDGDVNLLGNMIFTDRLAGFALTLPELKMVTSQARGKGDVSFLLKKLTYNSAQSQLTLENQKLHLALANPQIEKNIYWRGDELRVDNAVAFDALVEDRSTHLFIKRGRFSVANTPDTDKAEQTIGFGLTAAEWKSEMAPLNALDVKFAITHVPDSFIHQLVSLVTAGQVEGASSLFELIKTQLLPVNPQLKLEHFWLGPDNKTAQFSFVANLPPTLNISWADIETSPAVLPPLLKVQGDFAMDKLFFEQMLQKISLSQMPTQQSEAQALQMAKTQTTMITGLLLGQGLVADDKGLLKTRLDLQNGILTLNDKPFVLPF